MKKLQFKPEDFKYNSHDLGEFGQLIRIAYAANEAQKIFEKWYAENIEGAPQAYQGFDKTCWHVDGPDEYEKLNQDYSWDRKAKLICIEEIPNGN